MTYADEFKLVFDEFGLDIASRIFDWFVVDYINSPWTIIVDFCDGSTFRYYI